MYLYQSRKLFEDFIIRTAEYFSLSEEIIEKDYFVSLFLKRIAEANPNIVFKGGTSLSKAYQLSSSVFLRILICLILLRIMVPLLKANVKN